MPAERAAHRFASFGWPGAHIYPKILPLRLQSDPEQSAVTVIERVSQPAVAPPAISWPDRHHHQNVPHLLRSLSREAFVHWRYRADGGRCVTDDGEMIVDVLLCFWAPLARELDKPPGWARAWAWMVVPVLAAERDDAWWFARERQASRRRKGDGWKPDAVAERWLIREWELIACFGEDHRRRCGLVSKD